MATTLKKAGHGPLPRTLANAGDFFNHLVRSKEFSEFSLILKKVTGLSMALNTPDVRLTCSGVPNDRGNPLCRMIRLSETGRPRCEKCDQVQHVRAGASGKPRLYACHAGFYDMAVPILIQGTHVATISSGQILPEPPSDRGFQRMMRRMPWLEVPERRLRQAYRKAPWLPKDRLSHVMKLIGIFARQICDSACRIRELEAHLQHPGIRMAQALVEDRFRDPHLALLDGAAAARLSAAHFSHLFHRQVGITFTRYVQARRVTEAKTLLRQGNRSITDICFACGFSSLTHFNRVFRRGERCSPRQFSQAALAPGNRFMRYSGRLATRRNEEEPLIRINTVQSKHAIAEVARLAREIWLEHYVPIIGHAQVDYMLDMFQSPDAIARQQDAGYQYYLAVEDEQPVGYFSLAPDKSGDMLMLSKLYLKRSARDKGIGRTMLDAAENLARRQGFRKLWLTVNKHNQSAIAWYIRMGFSHAGPTVQDIGGGFIMDDYRMEKPIV